VSNDEIKRRWREKNATRAKAIPVEVPGVGQVYVRPLKVADGNALAALANSTDDDAKATIMAGLLCTEDGQRLAPDDIKEWTEIFKDADWSDYLLVTAAGTKPLEDNSGN
jgi:hypothetical protein